jgi:hypothetical protein
MLVGQDLLQLWTVRKVTNNKALMRKTSENDGRQGNDNSSDLKPGALPEFLNRREGADPKAICNLYLILKIML